MGRRIRVPGEVSIPQPKGYMSDRFRRIDVALESARGCAASVGGSQRSSDSKFSQEIRDRLLRSLRKDIALDPTMRGYRSKFADENPAKIVKGIEESLRGFPGFSDFRIDLSDKAAVKITGMPCNEHPRFKRFITDHYYAGIAAATFIMLGLMVEQHLNNWHHQPVPVIAGDREEINSGPPSPSASATVKGDISSQERITPDDIEVAAAAKGAIKKHPGPLSIDQILDVYDFVTTKVTYNYIPEVQGGSRDGRRRRSGSGEGIAKQCRCCWHRCSNP